MTDHAAENERHLSEAGTSGPTMVRLPIHSLRRPSVVPASDLSPIAPHPTGSPPPDFSLMQDTDRGEKDLEVAGVSVGVTRVADVDGPPAPAYSPPRRSRSVADHQRQSITQMRGAGTGAGQVKVEMGPQDMKQMVIEDYHAIKHFMKHVKWRDVWPKVIARTMWKWYAIIAVAITLTVLVTTQHDKVVHWCAPVTHQIRSWPGGWMIPIVLLIIVSYPPLVGHEIIGILIGLVWGLGEGFAILAAGTFIGEILLWFSFKWCCTNAASKFEKKNKLYWSLTQLIREKTFVFVLILRFSAIPGHIVTAVSASAGANYWSYLAAAFLTLPKQFTIVYLGSAFGHKEKKHVIISTVTMITTIVVTGIAAIYIYYQMRMVMKRKEAQDRANSLPTHSGDLQMVETGLASAAPGTWAAVADAQGKTDDLEVYVPELGKEESKSLAARRPWLFTTPSYRSDLTTMPASRAWSVPHHMTESEMKEFQQEMESGGGTPMVRVDDAPPSWGGSPFLTTTSPVQAKSSPTESVPPRDWDLLGPPAARQAESSARVSTSSDRSPGRYSTSRSTASLDLARPTSPAAGGREIADDADYYAYSRGGRRPDYNRMRGESRAALLGRPAVDDAGSVKSGKSEVGQV